jgi:methanogenic corrinoid protein MtbC1
MDYKQEIASALVEIEEDKATGLVTEGLAQGTDPELLLEGVTEGLHEVGRRFETKEYFMLELMETGEIGKKLIAAITPYLPKREGALAGKVVIGSTKGDIHDIGKNLIITQLQLAGFEVVDLGVDVPTMTFIDKAVEIGADIIAMSAFMTTTMAYFGECVDYLRDMGLRDKFFAICGGMMCSPEFIASIGADGTAEDAVGTVKLCQKLIASRKEV